MTRSFQMVTLGCKVNQYESAHLKEALSGLGWREALGEVPADAVVVNTCVVTREAAHQSRQALRKAVRQSPNAIVAAVGCYGQVYPEDLLEISGVDLVVGNTEKVSVPELLARRMDGREPDRLHAPRFREDHPFDPMPIHGFPGRSRAFLKIQDGCRSFCSYCIVAHARGPYRSLPPGQVGRMIRTLDNAGVKEVVLTGIHLGKYGVDLSPPITLETLLDAIGRHITGTRIRLSSIEPNEVVAGLVDRVADVPWLCRHFHIPLQSGDDGILSRMGRHYTAQGFHRLVAGIHDRLPTAGIGVDVMVGFPGEDDSAHCNTMRLIEDLPISYLHVFPFSARPGTPAAHFSPRVEASVIKERARQLRELGTRKKAEFFHRAVGETVPVLVERPKGESTGRLAGTSDTYLPVTFEGPVTLVKTVVQIRVAEVKPGGVFGRRI